MKKLNKILLAALAVTLFSCDDDFENPVEDFVVTSGTADFSKYVALGNSLTSGYTDNALFISGQTNSYPNILAGLMKPAGGGEFKTPFMQDEIGGFTNLPGFAGKLELQVIDGSLTPLATQGLTALDNISGAGPYQNMGVPGAKSYHLVAPGYGNPAGLAQGLANPYFARFASTATTSVIADAVAQNPTFFSLWIGNNDVLGYAIAGGTGVDQTGNTNPATYGSSDISDANVVKGAINSALQALTANGAKGVIANIPSVTSVPYFTTVPHAPLSPANPSFGPMIPTLNATYAGLNQVFDALGVPERKITFSQSAASAVVIKDKDLPNLQPQITAALTPVIGAAQATLFGITYGQARQATAKDKLVLPSSNYIGKVDTERVQALMQMGLSQEQAGQLSVAGVTYPLEDKWVLSENEVSKAEAAVTKYNAAIFELSRTYDLAIVDVYSQMAKLSTVQGIKYYGNTYTTTFVSGGAFSLDGIHLTGTGYAIVANMFADAINTKYGSNLRHVFPGNYPGIKIP
ncbi:SGNH/GDSL hydrolase family protein [Faecalibacter bovis]|uniref:G-D-S-L family lipolytic protein n=1 Tax=Faecalibacter bovis TaxID=2898187 RepID=A0ABX7XF15_9FLAO|nr:G-D-S-L family lipolytic protein [Faecalibacter bovis]QTV06552.1 G-D-S-L family lipolytic protein [Faecalibacter bovis]